MYQQQGFGLYLVEHKENHQSLGICGLLKRDHLPAPDLGFAFLTEFQQHGYAFEAASAVMQDAVQNLKLKSVLATCQTANSASIKLLTKLGFELERSFEDNNISLFLYRYSC